MSQQDNILIIDDEQDQDVTLWLKGGMETEREGLLPDQDEVQAQMQVVFKDIVMVGLRKSEESGEMVEKCILNNLSGVFHPGKMTAIMGTTGAGKTSLMNQVAGRTQGSPARVFGQVLINGVEVDEDLMKQISGYVMQDDIILETMTVWEALIMAAVLRLPKRKDLQYKEDKVNKMLTKFCLSHTKNSRIGGHLQKGISGGEKKRVSVAMEMITNPSILFLDEPTSGLDAYTAHAVCHILKELSLEGCNVVSTIHQPSSEIFAFFDYMLIVHSGNIVYSGPRKEMVGYFEATGEAKCGEHTNPADWLFMDVLNRGKQDFQQDSQADEQTKKDKSLDTTDRETRKRNEIARLNEFVNGWKREDNAMRLKEVTQCLDDPKHTGGIGHTVDWYLDAKPGFGVQFGLLARRSFNDTIRNKMLLNARLAHQVSMSLLIGILYFDMDTDQDGVGDREGAIYMMICSGCLAATTGPLPAFFMEKEVFLREYSAGIYGLAPYFLSKVLVDLPFRIILPIAGCSVWYWMCGFQNDFTCFVRAAFIMTFLEMCAAAVGLIISCVCSDIHVGLGVAPLTIIPFIVFSGYLVNLDSIPAYYWPFPYMSPMKYCFVGMCKNEFEGLTFYCKDDQLDDGGNCEYETGEEVITDLSFDDQGTIELNLFVLLFAFFFLTFMAFLALWHQLRQNEAASKRNREGDTRPTPEEIATMVTNFEEDMIKKCKKNTAV